jgi:uncharacterized protein involved in tolerance to divalent cations
MIAKEHPKIDKTELIDDLGIKPLGWVALWPLEQPLLFWKGETIIDTTFSMIIKDIEDDPTSALRRMTDMHSVFVPVLILLLDQKI